MSTVDIASLTSHFPVGVIMERRRVADNPWTTESWRALGVTVGVDPHAEGGNPLTMIDGPEAAQFLWRGLTVELFRDEAESYYHNLTVDSPGCYVVARQASDDIPEPVLVTVSFDAAQAYQEGDETVYSVPLPPALYRAVEAFVLTHYVPERKPKRKRDDWRARVHGGR